MPDMPARIRGLTPSDIAVWNLLAHQSAEEELLKELRVDPAVFYDGFDLYMETKIRQGEAFMAVDPDTGACMGIVAFSRKHNRITFLGTFNQYDFVRVGASLMSFAIGQLDPTRPVRSTVFKSRHAKMAAETRLYQAYGFGPCGDTFEAGVSATVMERPVGAPQPGGS